MCAFKCLFDDVYGIDNRLGQNAGSLLRPHRTPFAAVVPEILISTKRAGQSVFRAVVVKV